MSSKNTSVNIWLVRPRPHRTGPTESSTSSPVSSPSNPTQPTPLLTLTQSASLSSTLTTLLVFPLDTLKTRLQCPNYQQTHHNTNTTTITLRTLWRNLYRGVGAATLITILASGVFFTTYEGLKVLLSSYSSSDNDDDDSASSSLPQPAIHALSSSIAQLLTCAVVAPAEVLKQNAQMLGTRPAARASPSTGNKASSSSLSPTITVLHQLKRHPTHLWRGYTALAARDLPFTALQFPALEYLRSTLLARGSQSRSKHGDEPVMPSLFEQAAISAISAGVAGSGAAWVTTPLDVVKTRMMLEAGVRGSGGGRQTLTRKNGFQVGREVFQNGGVQGLFRGRLVRAAFTVLGNGVYMGCYEGAKLWLQGEGEGGGR
jgi:solute carrier family 25 S-adenosylmethionine transporter 26